jgi:hypothetical protein
LLLFLVMVLKLWLVELLEFEHEARIAQLLVGPLARAAGTTARASIATTKLTIHLILGFKVFRSFRVVVTCLST